MKIPREILLARHQAAAPKLDAIRREIMAGLNHQDTKAQSRTACLGSWCLGGFRKLWQELILPSRRIWSGLATVWFLLFVLNFFQSDQSPAMTAKISATEITTTFRDEQKILNELFADRSLPVEAAQPRIYSPKPRTENSKTISA